jgi:hypothetical protein
MTKSNAKLPTSFYCYASNVKSYSFASVSIVSDMGGSAPVLAVAGNARGYGA